MTMDPVKVIQLVRMLGKNDWAGPNWAGPGPIYTLDQFGLDIGVSISRGAISQALRATDLDGSIVNQLRIGLSQNHQKIESQLQLPGLFEAASPTEIRELVFRRDGQKQQCRVKVAQVDTTKAPDLIDEERNALDLLAKSLVEGEHAFLHLDVAINSGASYVAEALASHEKVNEKYEVIFHIRPSNFDAPYVAELNEVAEQLDGNCSNGFQLLNALTKAKGLLVIHSPLSLETPGKLQRSNLLDLLTASKALAPRQDGSGVPLLFIGESKPISERRSQAGKRLASAFKKALRIKASRRTPEFIRQWTRISAFLGREKPEATGPRMQRAESFYQFQVSNRKLWPINIRLRALFASNYDNSSYFDPSGGFERLAGPDWREIEAIALYHDDIRDFLDWLDYMADLAESSKKMSRYRTFLRLISCGRHWLTRNTLGHLGKNIAEFTGSGWSADAAFNQIARARRLVTILPRNQFDDRLYMGLAVKAIIQDKWQSDSPELRSWAFWQIANHLYEEQHNKELLAAEFPYRPIWGRYRIHFLAETIRYLVRSCQHGGTNAYQDSPDCHLEFPNRSERSADPPHTTSVINFCYKRIYQAELNNRHSRNLAKRYGAYQLSVELLELMSSNQEIGILHPLLDSEVHIDFMRDCAFALLDIGELTRSLECFELAEQLAKSEPTFVQIAAKLDTVVCLSVSNKLQVAQDELKNCEKMLTSLHGSGMFVKSKDYQEFRTLFRRVISRRAHLLYLQGKPMESLCELERIVNENLWKNARKKNGEYERETLVPAFANRLEAEQSHLQIAALRAANRAGGEVIRAAFKDPGTQAFTICLEALLHAQKEGRHHEAMGFQIVLSRIFREKEELEAAHTVMAQVHRTILRFGCSERTFLAFLNEAGAVSIARGEALRSFATYLLPSHQRSLKRGFIREARLASALALKALDQIEQLHSAIDQDQGNVWKSFIDAAIKRHNELYDRNRGLSKGGPLEKDPLFAYGVVDPKVVLEELLMPESIHKFRQLFTPNAAEKAGAP